MRQVIRVDDSGHDHAAICKKGHVLTETSTAHPSRVTPFCSVCGSVVLDACPKCKQRIAGMELRMYPQQWHRPSFCPNCAKRFPWTDLSLRAGNALIDAEDLGDEERRTLKKALEASVSDSPEAAASVPALKRFIASVVPEVGSAFKQVLVAVASAKVKHEMGL